MKYKNAPLEPTLVPAVLNLSTDSGITTAKEVFDDIQINVVRPKPKLVDKNKISES